jgi:uncharacterized membrane protein
MNKELIYQYFSDDDFLRISSKIKELEKTTSGEICVSIKEKKSFWKKNKSLRSLAEAEFIRLGIKKTKEHTGVLVFILLKERQFYVLADSGINEKAPEKTWDAIKEEMQGFFQKGEFCKGVVHGLDHIGKILSEHFPIRPDDVNELSNKVVFN